MARRREPLPRTLISSAARIKVGRGSPGQPIPRQQDWQEEAMRYRRDVPEIGYSTLYVGNQMAKMRLYPGYRPDDADPNDPPIPVNAEGSTVPPAVAQAAIEELDRLRSGRPTMAGLMWRFAILIELTGEAFLTGIEGDPANGKAEQWSIRSRSEIHRDGDRIRIKDTPTDEGVLLRDGMDALIRLYQSDAEWTGQAWAPMVHLLTDCRALQVLRQQLYAESASRLSAGAMFIANEFSPPPPDGTGDDGEDDPLLGALVDALTMPISDPSSAASIVPTIVRGPGAWIKDGIKHVTFGRDPSVDLEARLAARVQSLARGINLPPEVVMGHQQTTYANAGQVDEDTYTDHIEPRAVALVEMLTLGFLGPQLAARSDVPAEWANRIEVWFDPAALIASPDAEQSADSGLAAGVISEEAWRRHKGFSDTDAPTTAERLLRLISANPNLPPDVLVLVARMLLAIEQDTGNVDLGAVTGMLEAITSGTDQADQPVKPDQVTGPDGQTPKATRTLSVAEMAQKLYLAVGKLITSDEGRQMLVDAGADLDLSGTFVPFDPMAQGTTAPGVEDTPAPAPAEVPSAPPPAGQLPPADATTAPPPDGGPDGSPGNPVGVAASAAAPTALGTRLANLDRDLRIRVQTAAAAAMERALERAGSRIRARQPLRASVAGIAPELCAAHLGRDAITAAGLTDAALLDGAFGDLAAKFRTWTADTQARALDLVAAAAEMTANQRAAIATVQAQQLDAATQWLTDSVSTLAVARLYDPQAGRLDPRGEQDVNPTMPPGLIRHALAIAGRSATGVTADAVAISTDGLDAWVAVPGEGEVATGDAIVGGYKDAGGSVDAYIWYHGSARHPFDPHVALDGVTFHTFTDPVLANSSGWPPTPYYFPGDHNGCTCDFIPVLLGPTEGPLPVPDPGAVVDMPAPGEAVPDGFDLMDLLNTPTEPAPDPFDLMSFLNKADVAPPPVDLANVATWGTDPDEFLNAIIDHPDTADLPYGMTDESWTKLQAKVAQANDKALALLDSDQFDDSLDLISSTALQAQAQMAKAAHGYRSYLSQVDDALDKGDVVAQWWEGSRTLPPGLTTTDLDDLHYSYQAIKDSLTFNVKAGYWDMATSDLAQLKGLVDDAYKLAADKAVQMKVASQSAMDTILDVLNLDPDKPTKGWTKAEVIKVQKLAQQALLDSTKAAIAGTPEVVYASNVQAAKIIGEAQAKAAAKHQAAVAKAKASKAAKAGKEVQQAQVRRVAREEAVSRARSGLPTQDPFDQDLWAQLRTTKHTKRDGEPTGANERRANMRNTLYRQNNKRGMDAVDGVEQFTRSTHTAGQIRSAYDHMMGVATQWSADIPRVGSSDRKALDTWAGALRDALHHSPHIPDRDLYRGIRLHGKTRAEIQAMYAPGSTQTIGLSSFSTDQTVAEGFKGVGPDTVLIRVAKGKLKAAVPVQNISVFPREYEWISAGRYKVRSLTWSESANTWLLDLEQIEII